MNNNLNIKKKIKIISIDAANKSLAIACIECDIYDKSKIYKMANELNTENLIDFLTIIKEYLNYIKIKKLIVKDLIPGKQLKETNFIERSFALHQYLKQFTDENKNWIKKNDTYLIIEYQMGPNRKSGDVQSQILYHFLSYIFVANIIIIGPSLKNKIQTKDPKSFHNYHIKKYQTLYTANKSHTKYIFLEWLEQNKQKNKLSDINKKNYSDIADAFCQAIAWVNINHSLIYNNK